MPDLKVIRATEQVHVSLKLLFTVASGLLFQVFCLMKSTHLNAAALTQDLEALFGFSNQWKQASPWCGTDY